MTDATPAVSPLRRRMIDDMTLRNLSPATQRSYLHAVRKFSRYFDRSPDQLGLEDVRAFQVYLVSQGISWPALNQTVCALRFFYGVTLNRAEIPERIAYARTPRKLPTILSADEVVRFLEAVPSLKTRAALTTAYAAGLRASEAVSLKVTDSPDLNPIEMAFSKLKALVRKAAARTYDQLWAAVGHVCDLFSDEECYNYFKAAGYEVD